MPSVASYASHISFTGNTKQTLCLAGELESDICPSSLSYSFSWSLSYRILLLLKAAADDDNEDDNEDDIFRAGGGWYIEVSEVHYFGRVEMLSINLLRFLCQDRASLHRNLLNLFDPYLVLPSAHFFGLQYLVSTSSRSANL